MVKLAVEFDEGSVMNINVDENHKIIATSGLEEDIGHEIEVSYNSDSSIDDIKELILFVEKYVKNNGFFDKVYLYYGYWLIKLILNDNRNIQIYEKSPDFVGDIVGVNYTIDLWLRQSEVCKENNSEFRPPLPDQMVVISDGVYEGLPVNGVRYISPEHMSGWWLTTDLYNGDVSSLKTVHMHHLSNERDDLVKYICLDFGYKFCSESQEVWFDENVLD